MPRSILWKMVIPLALLILVSTGSLGFYLATQSQAHGSVLTIAWAVASACLLALLVAVLVSRRITRPVGQLTAAAKAITAGSLGQQVPVRTDDEIGRLGQAFNEMSSSAKNKMAEVADERGKLLTVLSTINDGVIMTDPEGKIVLVNLAAARLFNVDEARVKGKTVIEAVQDYEIDGVVKQCLGTCREQTAQLDSLEGRFLRVIAVPVASGRQAGAVVLFQDLTEMRSLQTMRREFVGNVSHELRTPLAAMRAIVDTLRDGAINDTETATDFLRRLDVEVDGMTQMVAELIELSRIETGNIKLNLEPVNLNFVIQEVAARLTPQAERQQVSLSTDLAPDLPAVPADKDRIRQVVVNITHNAIKFTPSRGSIVVSTKRHDDSVTVQVSDTGVGISRDDLPHIFERFFKADKSRSTSGTGLGLAIAKHTVQSHGGRIWVESGEGKGSTFSFSLPLRQDSQSQTAKASH